MGGDIFHNERIPFDYVVKQTKFAGPTCFQRGDNHYYNQKGEKIATQRSTTIRYRADLARDMGLGAEPLRIRSGPTRSWMTSKKEARVDQHDARAWA